MSMLRISIADDEPDMRDYYQRMLTHLGHRVVSCSANGRELVEECMRQLPDLVITDIKMPELDGLHAAEQIGEKYPVPVILVSAHHVAETIHQTRAWCVQACLVKPINLTVLSSTIGLARRRFQQQQETGIGDLETTICSIKPI